jgi:hypothetical protein
LLDLKLLFFTAGKIFAYWQKLPKSPYWSMHPNFKIASLLLGFNFLNSTIKNYTMDFDWNQV